MSDFLKVSDEIKKVLQKKINDLSEALKDFKKY